MADSVGHYFLNQAAQLIRRPGKYVRTRLERRLSSFMCPCSCHCSRFNEYSKWIVLERFLHLCYLIRP